MQIQPEPIARSFSPAGVRRAMEIEHSHCPCDCEHPQPVQLADVPENGEAAGKMVCGWCLFVARSACVMVPCTPETCPE